MTRGKPKFAQITRG